MKKFFAIICSLLIISILANANEIQSVQQKDFENKIVSIDLNGHKILEFSKQIKKIQFSSSEYVEADFMKNKAQTPLSVLKIYAKKIGKQNAIVTFVDNTMLTVGFNIVRNLNNVIELVQTLYPNITVEQMNENIILKGHVENQTQKSKLIEIFEKSGVDLDLQLIDLIKDNYSTKMVRVKLYVVQIDNNQGQQMINDWSLNGVAGSNFFKDGSKTLLNSVTVNPNITSLAGGITAIASRSGSMFDIGLTLNYLKKNNAARIVNESTLIMKENQEAKFNTGGKFFIKSSTTTAEGLPTTELREIEYGLNITMKAKKIIENQYIDFEAMAKSDAIDEDPNHKVDDIPGLIGNEVTTNVLIENGSTIVLAGILKTDYSYNEEKIPGLADIPLLGALFTSEDSKDENYDLVFFMTPEIVDPMNNNEENQLNNKLNIIKNKDYRDVTVRQNDDEEIFMKKEVPID
ncbi:MAG: hypothetical protein U9N30_09510 [Campylobacterota bacterium]|nr:hypothetical protein [Campylobacterota bacterium]